ncbi:unnamed protein product [Parnassius apollo]|uniref:(apollo) hypothetical protein n=1 Tax=Parnassius apollo TaxID=110799 RepID=A0A8S3X2Y6_PARAO|nr:unnamed protein product [Parnassius apollo]
MAGRDWIQGFLKKNLRISIRNPEATLRVNEVSDNHSTNNISEATASTSSRNVIGPQPSTSVDITNYKPNDSINQDNNKSDSEPLASVLSQLIPLPSIEKGKGIGKKHINPEFLLHTRGKVIKKIKELKKNLFKSSSSEKSADEQVPYDESADSDLENIEIPLNIQKNTQKERDQPVCTICLEEGILR